MPSEAEEADDMASALALRTPEEDSVVRCPWRTFPLAAFCAHYFRFHTQKRRQYQFMIGQNDSQ